MLNTKPINTLKRAINKGRPSPTGSHDALLISGVVACLERNMDLEKHYDLPYPPATVYAAWISSDTVIPPATAMDINPVVGGHYRLTAEMPGYVGKNEGEFLIVEAEQHIRYTWEWNGDGDVSEIDVTFSATPAGTRVD
ncbi:MAG: hypothetical protein ACI88G_000246, partial [Woeseiaceae bacterium]